jgi:hypothetical protein
MITELFLVLAEEMTADTMAGNSWRKKVKLICERDGRRRVFECSVDLADWKLHCISREELLSPIRSFTSTVCGCA